MLEVTSEASQAIKDIMAEKNLDGVLRVFLQQGCGGAQLGLGTDEVRDSDHEVKVEGLTFVVDKELSESVGTLKVDFVNDETQQGFAITSEKPLPQAEGGCGCGCSC